MYIISIYVKNTETGNEDFSMIGRDFLPIGKQDYSATVFETKEEAIAYLKSASYELLELMAMTGNFKTRLLLEWNPVVEFGKLENKEKRRTICLKH